MRFDIHLRETVRQQIDDLADTMKSWDEQPKIDRDEKELIRQNLRFFAHTTNRGSICVGGCDGSGDFPSLSYADSFVYVAVAHGTLYEANVLSGLKELGPTLEPLVNFTWLPENEVVRRNELDTAFAYLAGTSLENVIENSDYRHLKAQHTRSTSTTSLLLEHLVRPHASDAGNIGLQLRSTAELGIALRLIENSPHRSYILMDGTFSLPLISNPRESLFYEHLKRLCCVKARNSSVCFFALSKSHGIPSINQLEELVREKSELAPGRIAEHWYLRVPDQYTDNWELSLTQGRLLPPPGTVTYFVRFHRTTPVMRLDMDRTFWNEQVGAKTEAETIANEQKIFEDLDYTCHDQRCYGYPYPIKASHDRASLTKSERLVLRKQIIDAAVSAGLKRSLFRDASQATGHA